MAMMGCMVALLAKPSIRAAQYWLAMIRRTSFSELLHGRAQQSVTSQVLQMDVHQMRDTKECRFAST